MRPACSVPYNLNYWHSFSVIFGPLCMLVVFMLLWTCFVYVCNNMFWFTCSLFPFSHLLNLLNLLQLTLNIHTSLLLLPFSSFPLSLSWFSPFLAHNYDLPPPLSLSLSLSLSSLFLFSLFLFLSFSFSPFPPIDTDLFVDTNPLVPLKYSLG